MTTANRTTTTDTVAEVVQHKSFRDYEAYLIAAGEPVPSFVYWLAEVERIDAEKAAAVIH